MAGGRPGGGRPGRTGAEPGQGQTQLMLTNIMKYPIETNRRTTTNEA